MGLDRHLEFSQLICAAKLTGRGDRPRRMVEERIAGNTANRAGGSSPFQDYRFHKGPPKVRGHRANNRAIPRK